MRTILPPIDLTEEDDAPNNVVEFRPRPKIDEQPELIGKDGPHWQFAREGQCAHRRVTVDESRADLECRDCGEKLNPIWYLARMAKMESRWDQSRKSFLEQRKQLEERKRCKCQHCGKMTRI